jgi:hypothetical protein
MLQVRVPADGPPVNARADAGCERMQGSMLSVRVRADELPQSSSQPLAHIIHLNEGRFIAIVKTRARITIVGPIGH